MSLILAAAAALTLTQSASESAAPSAEQSTSPSPSSGDAKPEGFGMGDLGNVKASPERARLYVRQLFEREDTDHSGYIERTEGPNRVAIAKPRPPGSLPLSYSQATIAKVVVGDAAWAEYLRTSDTDGDGRISFEEYAAQTVPYYEQRGIPLIPADWAQAPGGKS